MLKFSKRNISESCKICSGLTIKTPRHGVVLVSLLLAVNIFCTFFSVSIADFEEVNDCWVEADTETNRLNIRNYVDYLSGGTNYISIENVFDLAHDPTRRSS